MSYSIKSDSKAHQIYDHKTTYTGKKEI